MNLKQFVTESIKPIVKIAPVWIVVGALLSFLNGCAGPAGPPGPPGEPGPPGVSGYEVVVAETAVDKTVQKQLTVNCPKGKKALGAGWGVLDPTSAILDGQATYFEPAFDGSGWLVNATNRSTFAPEWKLRVRLLCTSVGK